MTDTLVLANNHLEVSTIMYDVILVRRQVDVPIMLGVIGAIALGVLWESYGTTDMLVYASLLALFFIVPSLLLASLFLFGVTELVMVVLGIDSIYQPFSIVANVVYVIVGYVMAFYMVKMLRQKNDDSDGFDYWYMRGFYDIVVSFFVPFYMLCTDWWFGYPVYDVNNSVADYFIFAGISLVISAFVYTSVKYKYTAYTISALAILLALRLIEPWFTFVFY